MKNQRTGDFESCNRERKKTAFSIVCRREENSREQQRKLRVCVEQRGGCSKAMQKNQTEFAGRLEAEGKDLKGSEIHN